MLIRKEKISALVALCMLAGLSACRRDVPDVPSRDKSPIELTAGIAGESAADTKSVVTVDSPFGSQAQALSKGTSLYMVMKSEKDSKDALFTRTIGFAQETATATSNTVKFSSQFGRFWEDTYSRNSQLSVFAACVPGYYLAASVNEGVTADGSEDQTVWTLGGSSKYDNLWKTEGESGDAKLVWPLREASAAHQTHDFVAAQDLCFSNNVSDLGTDERVTFDASLKKFGRGNLVFYHALTKVTFRIRKGEGFVTGDKFEFTNAGENVVLKNVNLGGTFDIKDGEFKMTSTGDLTECKDQGASGSYAYVLDALLVPGTDLDDTAADQVYFTIDYNLYHLSKKTLMKALEGKTFGSADTPALDGGKMRPGVHYIFDMTVGKKKMDNFTASVVDWETVVAAPTTPTNARIVVSLLDDGTKKTGTADFALYRAAEVAPSIDDDYEGYAYQTGYEGPAVLTETTSGVYAATDWYWPDNKTFYHFRTVMPADATVTTDAAEGDYITLTGADSYTDVCWGAPFDAATKKVSKGIGPTKETINLVMYHMMSEVTIQLTTTTGNDQVNLTNALMEMSAIYPTAKVRMGDMTVEDTGTPGTVNNGNAVPWTHGFVPQDLENTVLTITTADNNQYLVNMKDVVKTGGSDKIAGWDPNHKYTYTFKLTKSGITRISATLQDWVEVTAGDDNVQIQ